MYFRSHVTMQVASEQIDALRGCTSPRRVRGRRRLAGHRLGVIPRRPIVTPAPRTHR
jgi:hypothetical protein